MISHISKTVNQIKQTVDEKTTINLLQSALARATMEKNVLGGIMENNVKRSKKFFTQKKNPTLTFVGIGLVALGIILYYFGHFIFWRMAPYVAIAGVICIIVSKSLTVSDSELDLVRTELLREMEKEAYGCFGFTKSETEQERHPVSGFDFTKENAPVKKGKEGKIYSPYVYAACLTLTNNRVCYGLKEFNAFDENSTENPKLTTKTFLLQNVVGLEFERIELESGELHPVMAYAILKTANGETHKLLMQDDSDIETLCERLDKRFKKNVTKTEA